MLATVVACFALSGAQAQNVNGVRMTDIHAEYLSLSVNPVFGDAYTVYIDYGQKFKRYKERLLKNDEGKDLTFNSPMDCVIKFKNYGYELFQVYSEHGKDSSNAIYVMKRK